MKVHLKPLEREGLLDLWDDTRIEVGTDWRDEIERALASATAAVLLISADFLGSEFIASNELPRLLEAHEKRGLVVLPLIVSPSQVNDIPQLSRFQAFNAPERPLIELRPFERERLLVAVGKRIREVARSRRGE